MKSQNLAEITFDGVLMGFNPAVSIHKCINVSSMTQRL